MKKTRREFLQIGSAATAGIWLSANGYAKTTAPPAKRPNIIMVLADDMGYSDIGPYGSEIHTPTLDRLAHGGLRFSQFYNNPRCCPSRASLMTGLYSQQAGMGLMTSDYGRYPYPGYRGDLSPDCVTIAEALRAGGYHTAMSGKWHLTPDAGVDNHNWPLQRGFEKFFGTIQGAGSYYDPVSLTRDNTPIHAPEGFYYTDAIADNAVQYIEDFGHGDAPFFLYTAFTTPHWPLHALESDIAKYKDRYRDGWDVLRRDRHARQLESGLLQAKWALTPRDPRVPAWELASFKEWEMRRFAVYAAMIDRMDQGIGRMVAKLEQMGILDNTLVMFMSDNGGNYEEMGDPGPKVPWEDFVPHKTQDGEPMDRGNKPNVMPGPADTYQSIGIPWGNCANTPFRLYKHFAHEGGISTPFIAHWPARIRAEAGVTTHQIGHETDIMPTCLDIAGVPYPKHAKSGATPPALAGATLLPVFDGHTRTRGPIFWEHEGNSAMRDGKWKLVSRYPDAWELYDMEEDRTELHDLSDQYTARVKSMAADWGDWAKRIGVQPWPMPQTPPRERDGAMPAPPYLRHDRL